MQSRAGTVASFSSGDFSNGAIVWQEEDPNRYVQLGPQSDVRSIALTPDGRWAVTATFGSFQSEGAKLWEAARGKAIKTLSNENRAVPEVSPDGRWLAVNDSKGCHLWDTTTWTEVRTIPGGGLAFTADGEMLAVLEGCTIHLVHPASGREMARLEDPNQDRPPHATFTPDGTQLIITGWDHSPIRVWNLRLIRQGLKELNLDWDAPELPAARPAGPPLQAKVDLGNVLLRSPAGRLIQQSLQHLKDKEPARALTALREAVRIAPDYAEAHNSLAWLLATGPKEVRSPAEALREAQRAIDLATDQPLYQNTLGVALYRNDNFAEAIQSLEKSLASGHSDFAAYDLFFLAMCHHRRGDADKAKDCRERAAKWFAEHRANLPPEQIEELKQFETEADNVFREPPQ